ncbi:hypothetical protein DAEQUDRAFT_726706, partial [Daedalea quercina L-15889]
MYLKCLGLLFAFGTFFVSSTVSSPLPVQVPDIYPRLTNVTNYDPPRGRLHETLEDADSRA